MTMSPGSRPPGSDYRSRIVTCQNCGLDVRISEARAARCPRCDKALTVKK